MRALVVAALLLAPLYQLPAQVGLHVTIGARQSASLVHDSIVTPFDVRPAVAPTLGFGIQLTPHRGWAAGAAFDLSRSQLRRYDADGSTVDLGVLGALSFMVTLRRELPAYLGARVSFGGLHYMPARDPGVFSAGEIGIFRAGSDAWVPSLGLALDWAPPPARARDFALELRGDVHRFQTRGLLNEGFSQHRLVPRLMLGLRVAVMK